VKIKLGYGDLVPQSPAGKVIAAATAVWGIMLIALPVAVVGSRFAQTYINEEKKNTLIKSLRNKKKEARTNEEIINTY
jgi:hypothetical protein